MEQEERTQLEGSSGLKISLPEYELTLYYAQGDSHISASIVSKEKNSRGIHKELSEDDVDKIVNDLKELSDWRHYRRLMNKISS